MRLSKTDFVQYLNCSKSLWLLKHEPEKYPYGEFSAFVQKLTREGYEVEFYVRQFFDIQPERHLGYQTVFESGEGLYAKVDALERTDDDEVILYEIKSTTSLKTDPSHNHLKDACFQKICAERSGQNIDRIYLVHLNGEYVRKGKVDPSELLTFVDITERVNAISEETENEIEAAIKFVNKPELDRQGCSCLYKSRANHCDTFQYFNPEIPTPSIYSLPRLSENKRYQLVKRRIFDLRDFPTHFELSVSQRKLVEAVRRGRPQVSLEAIRAFLREFSFPLYFIDFESFASAVPLIDGSSPHRHCPFQYSLHVLQEDGTLTHKEYLEREPRLPDRLVSHMKRDIGPEGSIVSWHASFEKMQDREMARLFPEYAAFLDQVNDRMIDLEDPFKTDYVDARFDGSSSIKKVLPALCPELGYDDLDVKDGTMAMESWQRMINAGQKEAEQIATSLLAYCERDTLAMVEIYRFLRDLVRQ